MRVAFDGEFDRLPPSGIGGYVRHLTDAIRERDPAFDLQVVHPGWDQTGNEARPLWRDRRLQRASWELFGFARAAGRCSPDLLHIPSFAAPIRSRLPFVLTIHDMIPFLLPEYRASRLMQLHMRAMQHTARHATLVMTPSHSAAREISTILRYPADRIRVTPEAADPAYQPLKSARDLDWLDAKGIRGRYIYNVGGLDHRKNVPLLIEAFAKVKAASPEPIQLVISGAAHSDNPVVFPPLEPLIRRLGLEGDVLLTGRVSEADKIRLYQMAALYVTPSAHEGFGLTALEAMACGVPTIAADTTSFPEVVGDGGLLVQPSIEPLAAAISQVLADPALEASLRTDGIARAATFSWSETARMTIDVYREALERASSLPAGANRG